MTIKTGRYTRKSFFIDAVQVTEKNLDEVAAWCQGDVRVGAFPTVTNPDESLNKYVKVRVHRPLNERQTQAFVGDWVLYAGNGFKVYPHKAFVKNFVQVEADSETPGRKLVTALLGDNLKKDDFVKRA